MERLSAVPGLRCAVPWRVKSHIGSVHSAEVRPRSAGGREVPAVVPAVVVPAEALAAVAVAEHPTVVAERSAVVPPAVALPAEVPAAAVAGWSADSVPMRERLEPA